MAKTQPSRRPVLRAVDAIMIKVPDLERGLEFYRDRLGHELIWRNDGIGQAGLRLPDSETEVVVTDRQEYEPAWLIDSVDGAVGELVSAGGTVLVEPIDIPVGRVGIVQDPFGNRLVLVDLSKGRYDDQSASKPR